MGKKTAAFEEAWAAYCGVKHAVLMSNGTVLLEAILHALGIGPGDEVITVSFSFNATVSAILRVGATPVLVDVREDDFCIDPAASRPRSRPARRRSCRFTSTASWRTWTRSSRSRTVTACGSWRTPPRPTRDDRGKRAGRFGEAMFASSYDEPDDRRGRLATTDDDEVADRLHLFRDHGMRVRYHHDALRTNFGPPNLAAALGLAQLGRSTSGPSQRHRDAGLPDRAPRSRLPGPGGAAGTRPRSAPVRHALPRRRQQVIERPRGARVHLHLYPVPIHRQAYLARTCPAPRDRHLPVTEPPVRRGARGPRPPAAFGDRPRDDRRRGPGRRVDQRPARRPASMSTPSPRASPWRSRLHGPQPPPRDRRQSRHAARRRRRPRPGDARHGDRPDRRRRLEPTRCHGRHGHDRRLRHRRADHRPRPRSR